MEVTLTFCFVVSFAISPFLTVFGVQSCSPCECSHDIKYGGIYVMCSGGNLTTIPQNIPRKTTTLLLNRNQIQSLPERAFRRFENLKHLDLSGNGVLDVDNEAFRGIEGLEYLNLDNSRIVNGTEFKLNKIFSHLQNLQILSAVKSVMLFLGSKLGVTLPLYSLMELYIDCFRCHLSAPMYRNLSLLSFSNTAGEGTCHLGYITNSTFNIFTHLKSLNLSGCDLLNVSKTAFLSLTQLHTIDVSFHVYSQQQSELVYLPNTVQVLRFATTLQLYLTSSELPSLSNNTRELYLVSTSYIVITFKRELVLPGRLEVLSLQNVRLNRFPSLILSPLKVLRKVNLSSLSKTTEICMKVFLPHSIETFVCSKCSCFAMLDADQHYLLPNITRNGSVTVLKHLRVLITRHSNIDVILKRRSETENIEYIDIANNKIREIDPEFVSLNNSLSYLNLANTSHDKVLKLNYKEIYKRFVKLKFLDISSNGISVLPTDLFQCSKYLRVINISNNILWNFNVQLSHVMSLKTLDLSNNRLYALPKSVRDDIERFSDVTVHLHGNPLSCQCNELDFLRWMQRQKDKFSEWSRLKCGLSTADVVSFGNLQDIVHQLEEQCKSNTVEILVSVTIAACVMTAVVSFLGYRNRWKLRYLYHVGRRGYRKRHAQDCDIYEYEAFVSYADEDRRFVIDSMIPELEDKCGLKLCIHHRDFLPGEVIATNIVNAIQTSRKTLIVLSPSFLSSTWCEYEYNMARMEGVSRRQEIVLVVLYKQVPMKDLPKDMAVMFKRNCYLEYSDDVFGNEVFWNNVVESIKTNRPRD